MDRLGFDKLARLPVDDALAGRSSLARTPLTLRRAWARSPEHLLLEYENQEGAVVAGQWMADTRTLRRVARQTEAQCPDVPPAAIELEGAVLLQPHGADRKLVGLRPLLQRGGATLLVHRPERRAVVRLEEAGKVRFAKIVRPGSTGSIVEAIERLTDLPDRPFAIPGVLELDEKQGVVTLSALEGTSVFDLLEEKRAVVEAAREAGRALRWYCRQQTGDETLHDAQAEITLLQKRLRLIEVFRPEVARVVSPAAPGVTEALAGGDSRHGLLHRDLYDKQIFARADGGVGLLDFDTASTGEAALDIANVLAHLELRFLQGRCASSTARRAAEAFVEAYDPEADVQDRIQPYCDATRLRLACLYAYRPRWWHLCEALVRRLGRPPLDRLADDGSDAKPAENAV